MDKKTWIIPVLLGTLSLGSQTASAVVPESLWKSSFAEDRYESLFSIQAGPEIAVAKIEAGYVQGYIRNGIYTYHGIPYAEAKERFLPAQKVKPWNGIRPAFQYGPISQQTHEKGGVLFPTDWGGGKQMFDESNACQNLKIWTPALHDGKKRPVMVWLHGGGFATGSAMENKYYDGENLSRTGDVVVVSVNHRLNVLGHLDLSAYGEKYRYSANVGILDIEMALRWIRDNISEFGGNPDNVTIFGESGGGAKVLALMTAPGAKGLFHKGIVESGAVESMGVHFNTLANSRRVAELTLEYAGISPEEVDKLQMLPYDELVKITNQALQKTASEFHVLDAFGTKETLDWQPVVDGDFLPTNPVTDTGFAAAGKNIPLLIGSNLTEWTGVPGFEDLEKSQRESKRTWDEEEIKHRLREAYGGLDETVKEAFLAAYPEKSPEDAVYIDTLIRLPMLKIMSYKADQKGAPVYSYVFSYEPEMMNGIIMSFHTAEIPFVFHNLDKAGIAVKGNEVEKKLEEEMSRAWVHFAWYGNPGSAWPPYTRENGATMIFDVNSQVRYHHDRALMHLLAPNYIW